MNLINIFESEQEIDQMLSTLNINDNSIIERIKNAIMKKRDDCSRTDIELIERERILKENINEIAQLDEAILTIEEQLKELKLERNRCEIDEETKKINEKKESNNECNEESITDIEHNKCSIQSSSSTYLPLKKCQKPETHSILCTMRILRQSIAAQKALIMKKLELNNCDKTHLDDEISKLQHLQKQYYALEKDISYNDEMLSRTEYCLSDDGDVSSDDILRGIGDSNSNSGESRDYKEKSSAMGSDDGNMSNNNSKSYRSDSLYSRSQLDNNCK